MKKQFVCLGLALMLVVAFTTVGNSAPKPPGAGVWEGMGWSMGQGADSGTSKPKMVTLTIDVQDPRGNLIKGSLIVANADGKQTYYDITGVVTGNEIDLTGNTVEEWPDSEIIYGFGTMLSNGRTIKLRFLCPDKATTVVRLKKQ